MTTTKLLSWILYSLMLVASDKILPAQWREKNFEVGIKYALCIDKGEECVNQEGKRKKKVAPGEI